MESNQNVGRPPYGGIPIFLILTVAAVPFLLMTASMATTRSSALEKIESSKVGTSGDFSEILNMFVREFLPRLVRLTLKLFPKGKDKIQAPRAD
jgi:hypothetical protein